MTISKRLKHLLLKIYKILPINIRFALSFLIARKFIVGIVAFVVKDNKLLLVKHSYQYPWGLPGGFLKPNENFSTSIEREIKEETNLKVKLEKILEIINNPGKPAIDVIVFCKVVGGEIRVDKVEVEDAKFFELNHYL
jgi:ADP-ribose pyrophosphatase YjhB (NUDIX family)